MSKRIVVEYSKYFSKVATRWMQPALRDFPTKKYEANDTVIFLASGMPHPNLFPFKTAQIELMNGDKLIVDEKKMLDVLQYTPSLGIPSFVNQLIDLQKYHHNPPTMNHTCEDSKLDLIVTSGSSDGLYKTFNMLISKDDNVIVEAPTYSTTLETLSPIGCNLIPVPCDEFGMKMDSLEQVLSNWSTQDNEHNDHNIPRIIYIIPNNGNPSGRSYVLERRIKLYKIAQKYNLVILEDDPYYFMQSAEKPIPSLLSMDVDGRVLRFDSFSKIFSPGLRVGFVTGPHKLIRKLLVNQMQSNMQVSGMSQIMISTLLEKMGLDGFKAHLKGVNEFYDGRKNIALKAAEKHLKGLAEWHEPEGGMFIWFKINGIKDSYKLIMVKAIEKKILMVPGFCFFSDNEEPSVHVRVCYSLATDEQLFEAFKRLAELIKEEQHIISDS